MPRMAATEQSSEPRRDYASPATWGDVESVRNEVIRVENRLERKIDTGLAEVRTDMARMEMRLIRWMVATMLAGVAAIGVLYGILEAVR